jgi:carbonic anhydrase
MNNLKTVWLIAALAWNVAPDSLCYVHAAEKTDDSSARLLRDASLMLLKEGNARYAAGKSQHPHLDAERRTSTAIQGQEPFATILACSDSRDPVELIFDRGVGDLFVVRVAGNVAGLSELASVEYGVGHLNTPLLIVMGHTQCGAVTAVVKGAEFHGHLQALAEKIKPAAVKATGDTRDLEKSVPKAIQANVWQTIEDIIQQSSIVRKTVSAGRAHLFGAVYNLEQGNVTWLGAHPAQDALIALANEAETDAAVPHRLVPPAKPAAATKAGPLALPVAHHEAPVNDHGGESAAKTTGRSKSH